MVKLGFWQLSRADQKQQRLAQIEHREQFQSYSLGELLFKYENGEDIRDYPLTISGSFDNSKYYLLDNKIHLGSVGYQILKLFETDYGRFVLVNLGWVGIDESREKLPMPNPQVGHFEIKGKTYIPSDKQFQLADNVYTNDWPQLIQTIRLEELAKHLNLKLAPFILLLDENAEIDYPRDWQPVVMPPEKHYGYAIQWFGLAIACLIIFIFANKETNDAE